jgi:hypothetical protein
MDDIPDTLLQIRSNDWICAVASGISPGKKLPGRNDREKANGNKKRHFADKSQIMKVILGTLLKENYAKTAGCQHHRHGDSDNQVGRNQSFDIRSSELISYQKEFDKDGADESKRSQVMKKSEYRGQQHRRLAEG